VKTNKSKVHPFREEQKYIGFVWNRTHKTVRLPEGRVELRLQQKAVFLAPNHEATFEDVEILVIGQLNHVSYLLLQLQCYLCSLYLWLKSWVNQKAKRQTPQDVLKDLYYLTDTLSTFTKTWMAASPKPTETGWVGDASKKYRIGALIGKKWSMLKAVEGWTNGKTGSRGIAWMETVAIRIGLLMLRQLGAIRGKHFIVWTDNTTAESAVPKRKVHVRHANKEWKRIQTLLIEMQVDIVAKQVTSEENKADCLSRGKPEDHKERDRIWVDLPEDLFPFFQK
jgi:hypothetical protein